ncbi:MAG TPA: LD-carboxypeptidase [Allosphingosinicella sp.]|jgi:muramoyltetrapeptide carboxypeptidase
MSALLAGAGAWPAAAAEAEAPRKPPRLRPGDTIGLVAPARFSDDPAQIEPVKATLAAMGLNAKIAPHVTARYGYLAGNDRMRADDINAMYADPAVRAVFAVQGGWGSARLLPYLDWDLIRAHPKLLVGFSDITALHLAFAANAGFPTVHAPNADNGWQEMSRSSFHSLAFDAATPLFRSPDPATLNPAILNPGAPDPSSPNPPSPGPAAQERWRTTAIRPGIASGILVGGNLSVLCALVGTPWLPPFEGRILFLEETGEAEYRVDRMLTQLGQAGILARLAGIVFGQCARCTGNVPDYSGFTIPQLLAQHLAPLGVPAFSGANIGHVANQFAIPEGVRAEIDAAAGTIRILEPAVV